MQNEGSKKSEGAKKEVEANLLSLVEPHLKLLSDYWLKALRDQAILKLPPEFHVHLPVQGKRKGTAC